MSEDTKCMECGGIPTGWTEYPSGRREHLPCGHTAPPQKPLTGPGVVHAVAYGGGSGSGGGGGSQWTDPATWPRRVTTHVYGAGGGGGGGRAHCGPVRRDVQGVREDQGAARRGSMSAREDLEDAVLAEVTTTGRMPTLVTVNRDAWLGLMAWAHEWDGMYGKPREWESPRHMEVQTVFGSVRVEPDWQQSEPIRLWKP